jgi:hypothetical protein
MIFKQEGHSVKVLRNGLGLFICSGRQLVSRSKKHCFRVSKTKGYSFSRIRFEMTRQFTYTRSRLKVPSRADEQAITLTNWRLRFAPFSQKKIQRAIVSVASVLDDAPVHIYTLTAKDKLPSRADEQAITLTNWRLLSSCDL